VGTALGQFAVLEAPPNLLQTIAARAMHTSVSAPATKSYIRPVMAGIVGVILLTGALWRIAWKGPGRVGASSLTAPANAVPQPAEAAATASVPAPAAPEKAPQGLQLFFVDDVTGLPVTNRFITLKGWERGEHLMVEKEVELQECRCSVPFTPIPGREYSVLSHVGNFADVRLRWNLENGEVLPDSHIVRLVRPVAIGGRVVDPAGHPVADAVVGFNTEEVPRSGAFSEDHCVDYLRVKTDAEGKWRLDRLAPEMAGRIFGHATHPEYSDSAMINLSQRPELLPDLLQGNLVFELREGNVVRGTVVDTDQQPVAAARVIAGTFSTSRTTEATTGSDGSFSVKGCSGGEGILTATAEGFAPAVIALKVDKGMAPVRLTLTRGKSLRLVITDGVGVPVPTAGVVLQSFPHGGRVPVPQVEFRAKADAAGAIIWPNAPEQELEFTVHAEGYQDERLLVKPDGEDHTVALRRALVISGTVRDSVTGQIIPEFRLGIGYPRKGADGTVAPEWSSLERFWAHYTQGTFRKVLTESVIGTTPNRMTPNPGFVFRFDADGHAPFITRAYAPDEGETTIDVLLKPVEDIVVVAYSADGKPVPNAEVGFIFPGSDARLVPGGFAGQLGHAQAWVRRTDTAGEFRVPGGEKINAVIIASPEGYAEISMEQLRNIRAVRLSPWGRVEGILLEDGKPVAHARLGLGLISEGNRAPVPMDFGAFQTTTADDGSFVFPKLPPIALHIYRLLPSGESTDLASVRVRPGDTIQVSAAK
jgi:hypothetical protein